MPDRPLTIAAYAAGASLAAITLVYVFGPTFFLDDEAASSSRSARKKGVVGLVNPANDCFINSVLQALAGLPELRTYLIREVHRRRLDGDELYSDLTAAVKENRRHPNSTKMEEWQILGIQQGLVTMGLKDVLDALNERPIFKKTISAQSFIQCVEQAFRTRISRSQQDAQEFLQVIIQRLAEEYNAGKRVRKHARENLIVESNDDAHSHDEIDDAQEHIEQPKDSKLRFLDENLPILHLAADEASDPEMSENIFPLQGSLESQVECLFCHFKPKPSVSSFLTLTLNVPHDSTASTLNTCFDQLLKQEYIEDFKCDKCRLVHALEVNARQIAKASGRELATLKSDRVKIEQALEEDPETPPQDVILPDLSLAPRRKISRFTRISSFPQILAVHLSRSVWDVYAASSKNMAKVFFPESLPLGSLLDRKTYRLLGMITHKGGHNSGHYESFRRQIINPPFSTPASMGSEGVYSLRNSPAPSPRVSAVPSPQLKASTIKEKEASEPDADNDFVAHNDVLAHTNDILGTPASSTAPSLSGFSSASQQNSFQLLNRRTPQPPLDSVPTPGLPTPPQSALPPSRQPPVKSRKQSSLRRSPKKNDRWWRISDEKIKECKTSDVLAMQREVYMLFYEWVPSPTSALTEENLS